MSGEKKNSTTEEHSTICKHAWIPASAASAALAEFAVMSFPTFSASERSNRPLRKARRVNSPDKTSREEYR